MTNDGLMHAQTDLTDRPQGNSVGLSLTERIEAQVARRPDAIAMTLDRASLTYAELNSRANCIAAYLRELGIGTESLVAIHLDRTFDLVAGIFAILKTGGAYVPLDLVCPEDRLRFMLDDSGAKIVITVSKLAPRFSHFKGKVICLDQETEKIASFSADNVPLTSEPQHLAYVIYTSGSTGTPKGCLVTQENVTRLYDATDHWFHFGPQDVWSLFHSSAFDLSVWEIFGALFYGGRIAIVPYMISRNASAFRELLVREKVTVLTQTPSAFRQVIQVERTLPPAEFALRLIVFAGEVLEFQSLRPWFDRYGDTKPLCINMYGITETTVHVTYREVRLADLDANSGSNIGVPIPDLQIHLLDPEGRPVAVGEMGEMYVGGKGVARGYLNRPELNAARFVANPFDPEISPRLYRSGDLAKMLPNGDLEYLGRMDQQVKIRGFRVELTEIESMLARHAAVRDCAVLARTDAGDEPQLVAYVVPARAVKVGVEELRAHLSRKLPDYMVPTAFVFLEVLPLTVNGKLDRKALPAPGTERPRLASEYVAPKGELEKVLAELFQKTLHQDAVGVNDNFFDLGADSLKLTRLHRQLQIELKRQLPITDLFQYPTVALLAAHLGKPKKEDNALTDRAKTRAELQRAAMSGGMRRPPAAAGTKS